MTLFCHLPLARASAPENVILLVNYLDSLQDLKASPLFLGGQDCSEPRLAQKFNLFPPFSYHMWSTKPKNTALCVDRKGKPRSLTPLMWEVSGLRATRPTSLFDKQVVGPTMSTDKQQQQNNLSKNRLYLRIL